MRKLLLFLIIIVPYCVNNLAYSQVPVREEPRHKMVLENQYIRLFDVHIAPHDTTYYHIHAAPSVVIIISHSVIGTQVFGKAPSLPGEVKPGATSYIDYGAHPLTHRVWNQSPDTFHVMDIELLRKPANFDSCSLPDNPFLKFDWEKQPLRVYHINLPEGKDYKLPPLACAHLLVIIHGSVNVTNGSPEIAPVLNKLQTGMYDWIPPQSALLISAEENAECVLLELK
jgi:hypothetical protein